MSRDHTYLYLIHKVSKEMQRFHVPNDEIAVHVKLETSK